MAPIMLDQESVGDGSHTKHQSPAFTTPTVSLRKIRKQTPSKSRRHRPSDILVFPPPPLAEEIIIVRKTHEAAFLPSPRIYHNSHLLQQRLLARPRPQPLAAAQKRPRILLSTKNFKWVKTDDAVWIKKRRIALKKKGVEKMDSSR
ncbi:hypothetical protein CGRA01v4_05561 [Colletotrichum graminicola]|uniref:Uncharacterized protein n=1 Tax=Colletotrichum graminicola (strain M1.001 / M2 / FGSC 10212) TaxID=645133 RepID=E3Q6H4_COLGM|nr:uncharacterized protein GLRG_01566 [Colletotrichum graminicola M1.001]EFQ26422.1 hypothetical protein GLRG_01566 [Colletotrichum graminicola M1.001]WDK14280.1 hypothetical protein CGRA01v4_05561 [Colletotrichum graminicola]